MKIWKPLLGCGAMIAGMALSAVAAASRIPRGTPIPIHWSGAHADGFVAAPWGLAATPLTAAGVCALFAVLPSIMPRTGRLERSETAYVTVWLVVVGFLAVLHAMTLAAALGAPMDVGRVGLGGAGVLLLVLGNFMGKIRYNYVFGVRTPRTLASERVWDQTHRFMGPVFMLWGAAVLLAVAGGWDGAHLAKGLLAGGAGLVVLIACAYSYGQARRTGAV